MQKIKMHPSVIMRTARLCSLVLVCTLVAVGLVSAASSAQTVEAASKSAAPTWIRTYFLSGVGFAQEIDSILPNADGSVVLVGYDWTSEFADSLFFPLAVKLDASGNIAWYQYLPPNQITYDLTGPFTEVIPGNDGGYVISGIASKVNPAQMDGSRRSRIVKVNTSGAITWQKIYETNEDITGIAPTADNTGYVAVLSNLTYGGIMRVTNSGSIVWRRLLANASQIQAIVPADSGSFLAAGLAADWQTSGSVWLGRVSEGGVIEWEKTVHPSPDGGKLYSLARSSDGKFLAAGRVQSSTGWKAWLLKFDGSGAVIWQRTYNTAGGEFWSLTPASDGGAVAVGYTNLVRVSGSGDLLWSKSITNDRWVHGITTLSDGGFMASGYYPGGNGTLTVMRMDENGYTGCPGLIEETLTAASGTPTVASITPASTNASITVDNGSAVMEGYSLITTYCGTDHRVCLPFIRR